LVPSAERGSDPAGLRRLLCVDLVVSFCDAAMGPLAGSLGVGLVECGLEELRFGRVFPTPAPAHTPSDLERPSTAPDRTKTARASDPVRSVRGLMGRAGCGFFRKSVVVPG
jgi:hypothetical protein